MSEKEINSKKIVQKKHHKEVEESTSKTSVVTGINSGLLLMLMYKTYLNSSNNSETIEQINEIRENLNLLNLIFKSKTFNLEVDSKYLLTELEKTNNRLFSIEQRLEKLEKDSLSLKEQSEFFSNNSDLEHI